MTDKTGPSLYRDRRPPLKGEASAAREAERRAKADKAWAEMEESQRLKRENMERLKAERLARDGS